MSLIERSSSKKLILDNSSFDGLSSDEGNFNERGIDAMSMSQATTETTDELCMILNKLDVKNALLTHDQIAARSEQELLERQRTNQAIMAEQGSESGSSGSSSASDPETSQSGSDDTLKMLENCENSNKSGYDSFDGKYNGEAMSG